MAQVDLEKDLQNTDQNKQSIDRLKGLADIVKLNSKLGVDSNYVPPFAAEPEVDFSSYKKELGSNFNITKDVERLQNQYNDKLKQNSGIQKTKHLDLLSPNLFTENPILYNFV